MKVTKLLFWYSSLLLLLVGCREKPLSFNQDIRPILNEKCIGCHGGVRQSGGFSLLFREDALSPTESGKPAIIPGKPDESEFILRLTHIDPDMRMPQNGAMLSKKELSLLKRWIKEGAKWETHWAYQKPDTNIRPPTVKSDWAKNDIDAFIYEKLASLGTTPNESATAASLMRRASLDLIGLPPTKEQIAYFKEGFSDETYSAFLDDLLASQHFGEKWAAMWLDLARFADTQGYEKDPHRTIWMYRDYVIDAFNQDKPFDEFTIEQIAGDLLPNPTSSQIIATAFNRNTMTNTEGGTDDEEYRLAAVIDRVNTTFEVWQGTTFGCVQCHAHPYDPFRHEDYYEVLAYFNNSQDDDQPSDHPKYFTYSKIDAPTVKQLSNWLQKYKGKLIVEGQDLNIKSKQALFPYLVPGYADAFYPKQLLYRDNYPNATIAGGRHIHAKDSSYALFKQLDLSGYQQVKVTYATNRTDAKLQIRLDSPTTAPIAETSLSSTGDWKTASSLTLPIEQELEGVHDLYVTFYETGDVGGNLFRLEALEFIPSDATIEKKLVDESYLAMRDSLLKVQRIGTPVMMDLSLDIARTTRLFDRGNWLTPTDTVQAKIPETLAIQNTNLPQNRLGFAQWLIDKENPLTARVLVNRLWTSLFGIGLVETAEDFGTVGESPIHAKLLDYLAIQFMYKHDWHIKPFLKELMLSATYRQSVHATPEKIALDPNNRFLSRGPRIRLSAEQLRDQALAVSGLLSRKMFGASVMPPQPEGVWQVVYSGEKWLESSGEDKYRRGVYTYWRRTSPYPLMVTFDAPSRELCVSRRIRTNTPLQALITLNDPVFLEAAEALAKKSLDLGIPSVRSQIRWAYETALLSEPTTKTITQLENLYHEASKTFASNPDSLQKFIQFPQAPNAYPVKPLASMKVVTNAIMNLDAFLTKG